MTAPPSGSHMEWHGGGSGPSTHPYGGYDPYHPRHDHRGPPMTPNVGPPPYQGGYSPHHGPPPPPQQQQHHPTPRIHPPKYWYDQQQQQQQQRRLPPQPAPPYGPSMYDGPPTPAYPNEGRQGPPPSIMMRGYSDGRPMPYGNGPPPPPDYYLQRRDMMYPPPFRTPPPQQRRGDAPVLQTSSFSSKEDASDVERSVAIKSSDWEPTPSKHVSKDGYPNNKKQGDPLSFLAKVAMAPAGTHQQSEPPSNDARQVPEGGETSQDSDETDDKLGGVTVTSPSKDDTGDASPLQRRVRSSPIITPNSVVVANSSHREPPPPMASYRDSSHPNTNTVTPKPITPTGTTHYGPPPSHRPHHRGAPQYGTYDDPRHGTGSGGPPGYPPYGMTPQAYQSSGVYGPTPQGPYPSSGYDSRSGSWEQPPQIPSVPPPAVVEERNSFDSLESSYGSSRQFHPYHPEYSRSHAVDRGYPPPATPSHGGGWQQHPSYDPRPPGGYPSPGWGGGAGAYEHAPPHPQHHPPYPPPVFPSPPHMSPHHHPGRVGGPPPPPPSNYYDERSYHGRPIPPGYGPLGPYSYVQQTNRDPKTILRKKFSWKHFPEVCCWKILIPLL
jgi:hypothetical protein